MLWRDIAKRLKKHGVRLAETAAGLDASLPAILNGAFKREL